MAPSAERPLLAALLTKLIDAEDRCDDVERPGLRVAIALVEWQLRGELGM